MSSEYFMMNTIIFNPLCTIAAVRCKPMTVHDMRAMHAEPPLKQLLRTLLATLPGIFILAINRETVEICQLRNSNRAN